MTFRSFRTVSLCGVLLLTPSQAEDRQTASANPVKTLDRGYYSAIRSVRISADGKTLVASSESIGLEVWDVTAGKVVADSDHPKLNSACASVAVTTDGKTAYVGQQEWVQVWDCRTEKLTATLDTTLKQQNATFNPNVVLSPSGKTLAVVGEREIQLWETATNKRTSRLKATDQARSLAYSADGKFLVVGGDECAFVWDVKTEKLLHEFKTKPRGPDDPTNPTIEASCKTTL